MCIVNREALKTGSSCVQEQTVEHVILFCLKSTVERIELVPHLQDIRLKLDIQDLLITVSRSENKC